MKSFSGKTVLVTGATGLIGSHIVYELMSMKNVRVIALGRNIEKIKKIFKDYINNANFYYVVQDVSDPIDLKNMFDRHNNDWGEFRKAKKDLIDKIAEKELKTEINERPNTNINPGA